jgi:hypothetical protein
MYEVFRSVLACLLPFSDCSVRKCLNVGYVFTHLMKLSVDQQYLLKNAVLLGAFGWLATL